MDKNPFFYINNLYMIKKIIKIKNKLKKSGFLTKTIQTQYFYFSRKKNIPFYEERE